MLQPVVAVLVVVVDGRELVDCTGAGSSATVWFFNFSNVSFWACDIGSVRLGPWGLGLGYVTPCEKGGIARDMYVPLPTIIV